MAIEPTDTTKKPAARRTTRRKPTAATAAVTGATKAPAARKTASAKPAATRKATTSRATTPRKPATRSTTKTVNAAKAVIASAPHNAAVAAEAAVKKVERKAKKSPVGLKTAIAAGIGTVGAVATAALLTLRGSTPKDDGKPKPPPRK